jgi:hypothetical protein
VEFELMSVGKQVSAINGPVFFAAYGALSVCFDWATAFLLIAQISTGRFAGSALRVRRLPVYHRDGSAALARSHLDLAAIHLASIATWASTDRFPHALNEREAV